MKQLLLPVFFVICIAELIALYFDSSWVFLFKPMIMVSLIAYYLSESKDKIKYHGLFLASLIFAWLGDVFLLGSGDLYFMLGLGSFLIMQLLYAYCFYKERNDFQSTNWIILLVLLGFLVGFNMLVAPTVGDLKIPVIVYSLAISIMVYTGITRKNINKSYWPISLGVLFFMISDSFIGINKFTDYVNPTFADMAIMSSYMAAQYFIVKGYLLVSGE